MGHLSESEVKCRCKKDSALGGKKSRVGRDREQQRRQEQWGKKGIDGGLTKAWYGSWCVCLLCSTVHGAALTAEPKRSVIWHVWCGPAPTIQPFVVPPHWAAWQWSAKQQWQRGPTIRMANLLMHPRADSLTFLFTTQSGCKGGEMREGREEGRKKRNKMLFFLQSCSCILPTQLFWFTRCHSAGVLVSLQTIRQNRVDTDKIRRRGRRSVLLMYLFGHSGLLFDILLLYGNQRPETSLHLEDGVNTHSLKNSKWWEWKDTYFIAQINKMTEFMTIIFILNVFLYTLCNDIGSTCIERAPCQWLESGRESCKMAAIGHTQRWWMGEQRLLRGSLR